MEASAISSAEIPVKELLDQKLHHRYIFNWRQKLFRWLKMMSIFMMSIFIRLE
jgi:hypothetical protein